MGASSPGEENVGTGPRAQRLEPPAWANQPGCCSPAPSFRGPHLPQCQDQQGQQQEAPQCAAQDDPDGDL